jgi:hypothetical protein
VRDALAFARWAVGAGGVATADLSLLLSPRPDEPPRTEGLVAPREATRVNLLKVLQAFKLKAAGKGADRLYFFYAGHGLSAPGGSPSSGPLIIPADTDDAELYIDAGPIGMGDFTTRAGPAPGAGLLRRCLPRCAASAATSDPEPVLERQQSDER